MGEFMLLEATAVVQITPSWLLLNRSNQLLINGYFALQCQPLEGTSYTHRIYQHFYQNRYNSSDQIVLKIATYITNTE